MLEVFQALETVCEYDVHNGEFVIMQLGADSLSTISESRVLSTEPSPEAGLHRLSAPIDDKLRSGSRSVWKRTNVSLATLHTAPTPDSYIPLSSEQQSTNNLNVLALVLFIPFLVITSAAAAVLAAKRQASTKYT